jgi:hypothetical protein
MKKVILILLMSVPVQLSIISCGSIDPGYTDSTEVTDSISSVQTCGKTFTVIGTFYDSVSMLW